MNKLSSQNIKTIKGESSFCIGMNETVIWSYCIRPQYIFHKNVPFLYTLYILTSRN